MGITRLCAIPLVSLVSLLTLRRGRKEPYRGATGSDMITTVKYHTNAR